MKLTKEDYKDKTFTIYKLSQQYGYRTCAYYTVLSKKLDRNYISYKLRDIRKAIRRKIDVDNQTLT